MKILKNTRGKINTNIIDKLIGKQTPSHTDTEYRLASYILVTDCETDSQVKLLANLISGAFISISTSEYESILDNTIKIDKPFLYEYLLQEWFLVPLSFDEQTFIDMLRNANYSKVELTDPLRASSFVIFTTSDCNARCYYCYEHGCEKMNMESETANKVADFIVSSVKNSGNNIARISWFGGEPILNFDAIKIITEKLINSNIKIRSSIITNGYLLDDEKLDYLHDKCNCDNLQITLDGIEDEYNKVKNYIYKDGHNPFETVKCNMKLCLDKGFKIAVRLNFSESNYEQIRKVIKWAYEDFINELDESVRQNITLYLHAIYANYGGGCGSNEDALERLYEKKIELLKLLYSYEDATKYINFANKELMWINGLRVSACMMDSNSTITILPNGCIGKCEHYVDDNYISSINAHYMDLETEEQIKWRSLRDRNERCHKCTYYATCAVAKGCEGSELCSPNFVKSVDYQNSIILNTLYEKSKNDTEPYYYSWLSNDTKNISERDLNDLVKVHFDNEDYYLLNSIKIHDIDFVIAIKAKAKSYDIEIFRYNIDEVSGYLNIYDTESLEESLVAYNWATKLVDNKIVNKIIKENQEG